MTTEPGPCGPSLADNSDQVDIADESDEYESSGNEEEDGIALTTNPPRKPRTVSEKKRADYATFDSWLEENKGQLARLEKRDLTDPEDKSAALLAREFESTRIIERARDYQVELFERAREKNIIAVLNTGSGKTLIAVLLLRHIIAKELQDRIDGKPKRISFFLVDKVALVFQQHAVLECNLDHRIEKFCGNMLDGVCASSDFWDSLLNRNMVVVCTAAVLQGWLHHSYIQMDQINLLIFDEAHHAKKNHPYARIVKDFYAPATEKMAKDRRPKIFGMTASPVDTRSGLTAACKELEGLLHAEVATVPGEMLVRQSWTMEKLLRYKPPAPTNCTDLHWDLRSLLSNHELFKKHLLYAEYALEQYGKWFVDRFWHMIFSPENTARLEAMTERDFLCYGNAKLTREEYVGAVRKATALVTKHHLPQPDINAVSGKIQCLHSALKEWYAKPDDETPRCMVFVEQKYAAMSLTDFFQQTTAMIPNLQVSTLVGGDDGEVGRASLRDQLLVISKFKRGEINCIFATSVGEEGLDIPDCNLVIRFDLYNTVIQYIQSRGRARHQNSWYYHMVEKDSMEHVEKVEDCIYKEIHLRKFCQAIPEDRKLKGNDHDMAYFLEKEEDKGFQQHIVVATGAKLSYHSSLLILAEFVSSLPHPIDVSLVAVYTVISVDGGYQCEVQLPACSPIQWARGQVRRSKQVAKCSAAFEMCLQLVEKGYLDSHLKPIFTKQLPKMRNARLAIGYNKKDEYTMRTKPELWSRLGTTSRLFATILRLSRPEAMYRPSRPLVLLTREPGPKVVSFPLFFGKDRTSQVDCVPIQLPLMPEDADLEALTATTLRMFDDIFSKQYEGAAADLPYFIAPCREGHDYPYGESTDVRAIIDWATLEHVQRTAQIAYEGHEAEDGFFRDKFVTDPFDGSRKYFLKGVRRDLSPGDPVPEGVPPANHRSWTHGGCDHNIWNYSVSLWGKSRLRRTMNKDHPVVEAEIVSLRRNLLDDSLLDEELKRESCFLVLDTLRISALPVDMVAMAYNFPAIIHRIESALIAVDACEAVGLSDIRPELALEALTKDSDISGDHDEDAINFQAGMGQNYERLELLGDSFLKMATTISVFTLIPDREEFEYHVERMCMICNRNLFNTAVNLRLEEYVRSKEFSRRTWYPPTAEENFKSPKGVQQMGLILKKGKKNSARNYHVLGDKTLADVCEALIGAAYLTTYNESFDLAVQAVSVMVRHKNHAFTSYDEYYAAYDKPEWQTAAPTALQLDLARQIKEKMGYEFRHPRLLRCAFMHPSYPRIWESLPSYQRLEFLGDALFDMAAVDDLFQRFPDKDPQWLTEHKMAMVSNQFLGALSVSLGFHRHVVCLSGAVQRQVQQWVALLEEARQRAEQDAADAGRESGQFSLDYWTYAEQPPKVLPDVLEAYVGAVFVDSGYDYGTVRAFFDKHVRPYFEDMALYDTFANKHPVTFAANLLSREFGCRSWRTVLRETTTAASTPAADGRGGDGEDGARDEDDYNMATFSSAPTAVAVGFLVHGRVIASGVAASGRYAKINAAKKALERLQGLTPEGFRALTSCDCAPLGEEEEEEEEENGGGDS